MKPRRGDLIFVRENTILFNQGEEQHPHIVHRNAGQVCIVTNVVKFGNSLRVFVIDNNSEVGYVLNTQIVIA